jgi:hypothetical protein
MPRNAALADCSNTTFPTQRAHTEPSERPHLAALVARMTAKQIGQPKHARTRLEARDPPTLGCH